MDENEKRTSEVMTRGSRNYGEMRAAVAAAIKAAEERGRVAGIRECLDIARVYEQPGYAQTIREVIEALTIPATPAPAEGE